MNKIKVIVVDDSALMRKIISDMINSQEDMEVINVARNGDELLKKLDKRPDVITLDVEMPMIDGIETLKILKKSHINIPVIMLSSLTEKGSQTTMECLELGAFDFISKPSGSISLDINKVQDDLVTKIRLASGTEKKSFKKNPVVHKSYKSKIDAVLIGASTGGPKALYEVITKLPKLGVPVFVVQHMPVGFTKAFAERMDKNSELKVLEAEEGMRIVNDTVYVAKAGYHMKVLDGRKITLDSDPPIWGVRPAVDKLFISASKVYRKNTLSLIMTGMGRDGAEGTIAIKDVGGITLSQDEETSTIYGMPKAAFNTGKVDEVVSLNNIAKRISDIVSGKGV